jgi:hypothetical protein
MNTLYRLSRKHMKRVELGKVNVSCYSYSTNSATIDIYNTHASQLYDYRLDVSLEYLESLVAAIKERQAKESK